MKRAFIVVDLVNDFVNGRFGSEEAVKVAEKAAELLGKISGKEEVIFTLDTHIPNDPEFRIWGEHCLMGTEGSELYPSLEGIAGYRIRKRHYDAFFQTDLDGYLRARDIRDLVIFGISSDICVLHTCAGAFFNNYRAVVVEDLCAAIDREHHNEAMKFIERNYGFKLVESRSLLAR